MLIGNPVVMICLISVPAVYPPRPRPVADCDIKTPQWHERRGGPSCWLFSPRRSKYITVIGVLLCLGCFFAAPVADVAVTLTTLAAYKDIVATRTARKTLVLRQ